MFYEKELNAIKKSNRFRQRKIFSKDLIDLASNDYLGLSSNKKLLKKAYKLVKKEKYSSSKSSLLVNGYSKIHKKFEDILCKKNNFEDGIILGSGFLANISLIEAMVRKGDLLLLDEYYHASGILASKLVDSQVIFFKHNDVKDLETKLQTLNAKRIIVAIEGVYSMHGDIAPKEIDTLAKRYNAILIVDEAHSSGVIGENLLGWYDYHNIKIQSNHIKMGTLGKAYGSYGAYILASSHIISFLENRAKAIIYTTALSLFDTTLAYVSFLYIQKHKIVLKRKIKEHQNIIKDRLAININSLILPLEISDNKEVIQLQENFIQAGFLVGAIRQPTVERAILRVILKLDISKKNILKYIEQFKKYKK